MIKLLFLQVLAWGLVFFLGFWRHHKGLRDVYTTLLLGLGILLIGVSAFQVLTIAPLLNIVH